MNWGKVDVAVLTALLLATIAVVLVLRTVGTEPGTRLPAPPGTATGADPLEPASPTARVASGWFFIAEHRVLDADRAVAGYGSRLTRLYLRCARDTSGDRMDVDEALYCRGVADALIQRQSEGSEDWLIGGRQGQQQKQGPQEQGQEQQQPAFAAADGK